MVTPIIVRMVNCLLSALKPMRSSVMFNTQIEMAVGMLKAYYSNAEIPDTPPMTNFSGRMNAV